MMLARRVLVLLSLMFTTGAQARAQSQPERQGFWAGVQLGYGTLDRFSDQEPHDRRGTFALGFTLGGTLNRHVRLGAQLSGWLLEGYDLGDPEKGENVSQVAAIVLVYPWSARSLFLKAGVGRAIYTNQHQDAFGSSGWGQTIEVGYDWPVAGRFSLTPVIGYGRGSLGHVENVLVTLQNRGYRVFDFGIALKYR